MGLDSSKVKFSNGLRDFCALVCVAILLGPAAHGRNKQGDKLLKLGEKAEAQKQYDLALNYYDQALATDPRDPAYLLSEQRVRNKAAEGHVAEGKKLVQQQRLDEALVEFNKAYLNDPSSQIAMQEIRQTTAMIRERSKLPGGTPVLTPAERARQEIEKRINSLEGPPTLRPITNQITSLKMNNQPARVLYETVGKLAGINVLFDPQGFETLAGKNFNLELTNVTLDGVMQAPARPDEDRRGNFEHGGWAAPYAAMAEAGAKFATMGGLLLGRRTVRGLLHCLA